MNDDPSLSHGKAAVLPTEEAPHLLVVDDDDRLRDLLQRYLSENGYHVSTANSANEAHAKLEGLSFDLIVLDIMMPGGSGVDFTRDLRETNTIPILLLTAVGEPEDRIAGLESGADDYLTKPFEPRELLLRIATILRRVRPSPLGSRASSTHLKLGKVLYFPARAELIFENKTVRLTTAEADLLGVFAANVGLTLSRENLCEQMGHGSSLRAIDVQVNRLRRKIEPDPREPRYLQTVWGQGYVLRID